MVNFTPLSRPFLERVYHTHTQKAEHVETSQRQLLADLLRYGASTLYGNEVHLRCDMGYEEFASVVPIAPYDHLRPYVMRMVEGERDVLWPGVCRKYAQSSGTSDGKSKYIPITNRFLHRGHYAGASFSTASYLHYFPDSALFGGKNFILGGSFANELTLPPGVRVGDLSATLIHDINPLVNLFRVPGKRTALLANWSEKLPQLVEASAKADVRSLAGVPSWFLTVLKGILAYTGASDLRQVWPRLEVFFHGGISFEPYRQQYADIIPSDKMHYWENYNASEGFFGVQARLGDRKMSLLMNVDVFYEFQDLATGALVPAWQVEKDKIYALVITASNGLWRYPVGDTVKIENTRPVEITIAGRTAHYINAFGEEVMVYNADAALAWACKTTGAKVLNYTVAPVFSHGEEHGHHQWLIEFAQPPADIEEFARLIDESLQSENSDYQAKRAGSIFLDRLQITVASPGLFDRWLASTGKLGGQRKVPRLANDRRYMDAMLQFHSSEG